MWTLTSGLDVTADVRTIVSVDASGLTVIYRHRHTSHIYSVHIQRIHTVIDKFRIYIAFIYNVYMYIEMDLGPWTGRDCGRADDRVC